LQVVAEAVEVPLSADTTRAGVARAALAAGACIINDVTGLRGDPEMAAVAASAAGAILVASQPARGRRASLAGVVRLLRASLARAERAGVALERIVLDPGIGFFPGSRPPPERFNCLLLARLRSLQRLGRPLLVGVSRKSFIGRLTGRELPDDRLPGSLAATALAVYNGAAVVRAHDVAATRDAVGIAQAIARARTPLTPGRASR
jgi:dihydropteroate synthase